VGQDESIEVERAYETWNREMSAALKNCMQSMLTLQNDGL
jgi:hypothetical protein